MGEPLVKVYIEGRPHEVPAGLNLLQASLALGFEVPYFCWHPALGSIGACRQCAVKQFRDENDTRGKIVMACMTPAVEGTRISIADGEAIAFRAAVIEWLMTNHPHDCPVCDEGGECHLQDMTQLTGHTYRRFRFRKRTFHNQSLGPAVMHEMNRCIQCYRCVRFYRDYAGGGDLHPFALRNLTWFGRSQEGTLASPFSGNLVEVCPTGVFTDKTLHRHYARPWDLQTAPSICVHCGVGCNTIAGERYGTLRRIRNRYHPELNGFFLCDRGRYGYEFLHYARLEAPRGDALRVPQEPDGEARASVSAQDADALLDRAAQFLAASRGLAGIGSPRASLESNFALRRLVGPARFCNGLSARQARLAARAAGILRETPGRIASLADIENADAILVLGVDLLGAGPRFELGARQAALRQAAGRAAQLGIESWNDVFVRIVADREASGLMLVSPRATSLDRAAREVVRASPEEAARLGFAIAHELDAAAPEPGELDEAARGRARAIASALRAAGRPAIVSGIEAGCAELLAATANIARALANAGREACLALLVPECNTMGVTLLSENGIELAADLVARGEADTLIVLENDLARRCPPRMLAELLGRARLLVVDHLATPTAARAALALPAAPFSESAGTLVNHEGRLQRHYAVHPPRPGTRPAWQWLVDLGDRARVPATGTRERAPEPRIAELWEALARETPALAAIAAVGRTAREWGGQPIPRQPARYSGRTAMIAHREVHEPAPPTDPDTPFSFSMEGHPGEVPAEWIARYWAPGWNSVQALHRFHEELAGPLRASGADARAFGRARNDRGHQDPRDERADGTRTGGARPAGGFARPGSLRADALPSPLPATRGILRLLTRQEVFGSEELSDRAPAVRERRPEPEAVIGPEDARALGLSDGGCVRVIGIDGETAAEACAASDASVPGAAGLGLVWLLPLRIDPTLPAGHVVVPAGYREQPAWETVAYARVEKPQEEEA